MMAWGDEFEEEDDYDFPLLNIQPAEGVSDERTGGGGVSRPPLHAMKIRHMGS